MSSTAVPEVVNVLLDDGESTVELTREWVTRAAYGTIRFDEEAEFYAAIGGTLWPAVHLVRSGLRGAEFSGEQRAAEALKALGYKILRVEPVED